MNPSAARRRPPPGAAEPLRLVEGIRSAPAPAGVATRNVAIDGAGGAGKSSLAAWLANELDAPVIHTDDFASWESPLDWWPELLERASRRARGHLRFRSRGTLDQRRYNRPRALVAELVDAQG